MPTAADLLRAVFEVTARAREKAKKPDAFLEWLDGEFAPHRAKHASVGAGVFDRLQAAFDRLADTTSDAKLAAAVESLCRKIEETEVRRIRNNKGQT